MDLDRLNRWLSLGANIGIILGIIFLVIEVNQNTRSLDESRKVALANSNQQRLTGLSSSFLTIAASEELSTLRVKVEAAGWPNPKSLDSLSPVELLRWRLYQQTIFLNVENMFYQASLGLIDNELYEDDVRDTIKRLAPGWEALGFIDRLGRPSFQREINNILEE